MFLIDLIITVPDIFLLICRNAFAMILDFQMGFAALRVYPDFNLPAVSRIIDGIDHEVVEHLRDSFSIGIDRKTRRAFTGDFKAIGNPIDIIFAKFPFGQSREIESAAIQLDLVFFQL